jgi:hypothetical protein
MLQAGEETNLSDEAELSGVGCRIGVQNLECDGPLMPAVARKIYSRERALPYLSLDLVATPEGNAQRCDRIQGRSVVAQTGGSRDAGAGEVLMLTTWDMIHGAIRAGRRNIRSSRRVSQRKPFGDEIPVTGCKAQNG